MNTEKIEKLKKGLTNSQIPESLREKIREQIKKMEAEDLKESAPKVVNVAPEEKEKSTPAPKVEKAKVTRTPRVKKVVEHKESTTKKPTAMALAKEIRKDGESWKEAVKRASSEMKKGTTETKKAVVETKKATITEMQKLLKFVKRRKELKNISGTNLQRDASRSAKPSGKRTSKEGNVYYENRENRTDRLAPNYPKGAPKLANGGFMDGVYAENGAEVYRKKASENQKEKEKSMVFKKYRVNVYEDSYPFVDPHYTDNFVEAVMFAKKTIKEQKQYRPSSKDLFTSIDKFTPIEQRGNVIYPYYEIARFNEKDLNESKFANGGMMNNMSVHEGTDFMNTPVYAGGGGVGQVEHFPLDKEKLNEDAKWYADRIKSGKMSTTKKSLTDDIEEYKKDLFLLEVGRKKPSNIIGTGYKGNTKKMANTWLLNEIYKNNKILELLGDNYSDGGFMDGVYAEEGAEIDKRDKQGMIYALQEHISSGEIANMTHLLTYDSIAETRSKAIQYYVKYGDKPYSMTELKNVLSIVSTPLYHKYRSEFADGGDFMNSAYAEEGAEVTYTRNKDGIRVKSVAMPEERLTEAEWLAKHNESREARTYAVGGGIFADTFTGETGTHYTGLVGETNAMSSGEMFMAGGRVRRTKAQMTKDRENKEIDAYNWYVVDLEENKAITGNEYKEDAVDALSDYDGDKRYKVVSKKTLKSLGIENPNERFKSYEVGGGVGELFPYAVGNDFTKENSFEISKKDIKKYKSMGFEVELLPRKDIDLLKKIQLADEKKLIERKIYDEIQRNDKRTDIQKTQDEIKELGFSFSNEIKEYDSLNWHYNIIDNDTGEVYGYEVDSKTMIAYPINEESKDYINMINHKYAKGGGVRTQNGREYSLGRNWTNDHRHENKHEDYEVSMYKRK